jgi:hypothetical protein
MTIEYIVTTAGLRHVRKSTGTIVKDDGETLTFQPNGGRFQLHIPLNNVFRIEVN